MTASEAMISPGPAWAQSRAARLRALPRYPSPTGTASPASSPMPTPRGSSAVANPVLKLDRSSQGLTGGHEHDKRFIAPELEQESLAGGDDLLDELGEPGHEVARGLVAKFGRVSRVAPDIGDQKGPRLGPAVLARRGLAAIGGSLRAGVRQIRHWSMRPRSEEGRRRLRVGVYPGRIASPSADHAS